MVDIGQAVSELFAREGATVVIWDVLDAGEETAAVCMDVGYKLESISGRNWTWIIEID